MQEEQGFRARMNGRDLHFNAQCNRKKHLGMKVPELLPKILGNEIEDIVFRVGDFVTAVLATRMILIVYVHKPLHGAPVLPLESPLLPTCGPDLVTLAQLCQTGTPAPETCSKSTCSATISALP